MCKYLYFFIGLSTITLAGICEEAPNLTPQTTTEVQAFAIFTGKINANNVRLRQKASLESPIIHQFQKNDLVLVVGEDNTFYKVEAPSFLKSYIFKSYILDGVVEAHRVNMRSQPNTEAPILGQLDKGAPINGKTAAEDQKWLEMDIPSSICFYIAKDFVTNAGDSTLYTSFNQKVSQGNALVDEALFLAKDESILKLQSLINEYADIPCIQKKAEEKLALLQKKAEEKKNGIDYATNPKTPVIQDPAIWGKRENTTADSLITYTAIEDSLFSAWRKFHQKKSKEDFYEEQLANSQTLEGTLEKFSDAIQNKPGNYILKKDNLPVAYVYSTKVDLEKFVGQEITAAASPRDNNNFAFPAYFINSIK